MGNILQSQCKCGYTSDTLFVGGGMIPRNREYYLPCYCDNCEIVIERNIMNELGSKLKKYNKCSKCLKKIRYYGSISKKIENYFPSGISDVDFRFDFDNRYDFDNNNNHCPKCKKKNLKFNILGGWD